MDQSDPSIIHPVWRHFSPEARQEALGLRYEHKSLEGATAQYRDRQCCPLGVMLWFDCLMVPDVRDDRFVPSPFGVAKALPDVDHADLILDATHFIGNYDWSAEHGLTVDNQPRASYNPSVSEGDAQ